MSRPANAVDFWRGFALVTIFVDHTQGILFERFTLRNFAVSDTAELFVFLAGWSLRIVVDAQPVAPPALQLFLRLLGRAVKIYVAQIALSTVALALVAAASLIFDAAFMLDWINAGPIFEDPIKSQIGLALLTQQLGYFNILPLYVVLMFLAPLVAMIDRISVWLVMALSLAVYAGALATGSNLPTWPAEGRWYFNPFAWQLVFVLGFAMASRAGPGAWIARHRMRLFWFALPLAAAGTLIAIFEFIPDPIAVPSPKMFFVFDKTFASPARIISLLVLVCVFAGTFAPIERLAPPLAAYLSMLGRNSLNVFCIGSLLSLLGQIARFLTDGGPFTDTLVLLSGLIIIGLTAWISEWRDHLSHLPSRARQ